MTGLSPVLLSSLHRLYEDAIAASGQLLRMLQDLDAEGHLCTPEQYELHERLRDVVWRCQRVLDAAGSSPTVRLPEPGGRR